MPAGSFLAQRSCQEGVVLKGTRRLYRLSLVESISMHSSAIHDQTINNKNIVMLIVMAM
jgi:hypothetical protein